MGTVPDHTRPGTFYGAFFLKNIAEKFASKKKITHFVVKLLITLNQPPMKKEITETEWDLI